MRTPQALVIARAAAGFVLLSWGVGAMAQAPQPLPGLTARETRAEAIWAMRAGLNVAALQCQFSPFLATVANYNALLRHHSDEMADAFKAMTGYFVRQQGPRTGQRAFDTYATRTNQGWSTFDAQVRFCNAAALVGRRALAVPKGAFGDFAQAELASFRQSVHAPADPPALAPRLEYVSVPEFRDPCPGRPITRCR